MAKPTWSQLIENIPRSRLIDKATWDQLLAQWNSTAEASQKENVDAFLDFLVDKKAITTWHRDNILTGKYKGYFLGAYKLLQHIGSGGMSSVYLAEHTMMGREVAIKILPRSRVNAESSYLKRFLQEAQAAAALNHPHIVTAYDIDSESGIYYLVMEYVNGEDLSGLVKRVGPLEYGMAADYICQAAEGLAHAHENGLIHRDMKPANLLVDKEGVVKILDMGLALFTETDRASLTLAYDENVLGTADYLAPEQARNSHTVDARADIYGLGCTLYFLLTGHPPFTEGTLPQRILAHQKKEAPPITNDRPDCPPDLVAICKKMMAKKAENRQQSMLEVQENLTDWRLVHGFLPNNESLDNIVRSRHRLDALQKSVENPNSTGVPETGSFVNLDLGFMDGASVSKTGNIGSSHGARGSDMRKPSDLRKNQDSSSNGKNKGGFFGLFGAGKNQPKSKGKVQTGRTISGSDSKKQNTKPGSSPSAATAQNTASSTTFNFLSGSPSGSASTAATQIDPNTLSAIVAQAEQLADDSGPKTGAVSPTASPTPSVSIPVGSDNRPDSAKANVAKPGSGNIKPVQQTGSSSQNASVATSTDTAKTSEAQNQELAEKTSVQHIKPLLPDEVQQQEEKSSSKVQRTGTGSSKSAVKQNPQQNRPVNRQAAVQQNQQQNRPVNRQSAIQQNPQQNRPVNRQAVASQNPQQNRPVNRQAAASQNQQQNRPVNRQAAVQQNRPANPQNNPNTAKSRHITRTNAKKSTAPKNKLLIYVGAGIAVGVLILIVLLIFLFRG